MAMDMSLTHEHVLDILFAFANFYVQPFSGSASGRVSAQGVGLSGAKASSSRDRRPLRSGQFLCPTGVLDHGANHGKQRTTTDKTKESTPALARAGAGSPPDHTECADTWARGPCSARVGTRRAASKGCASGAPSPLPPPPLQQRRLIRSLSVAIVSLLQAVRCTNS